MDGRCCVHERDEKRVNNITAKPGGRRPLERHRRRWKTGRQGNRKEGSGVDSTQGPVAVSSGR